MKQVLFRIESIEKFQEKISEENKKLTGKCPFYLFLAC